MLLYFISIMLVAVAGLVDIVHKYLNHSFIKILDLCTSCGKVCIIFSSYPQVLFYLVFDGINFNA